MGGWGSGRRWQSTETTGDYLWLDVRRLQRDGMLECRYSFNWRWKHRNGEPIGNIGIRPEADRVILSYRDRRPGEDWTDQNYAVLLERTPCNYGGQRVWFRCPARGCGRRVAIVYGGAIFACRHCYKLTYPTQRQSFSDRAATRTEAIRERLGGVGTIFDPTPPKPKGMHQRTYERLTRRYSIARYNSLVESARRMGMHMEDPLELG